MENFPGMNPDFSSLAEKPSKTPEKKRDDDDDEEDEKPSLFERDKKSEKSEEKDKQDKKEPPLDKLADDEKQLVVSARKAEVDEELDAAPEGTVAENEALVAATFLDVLESEVEGNESIEQALANAEAQALDIAGLEAEDTDSVETIEIEDIPEDEDTDTTSVISLKPPTTPTPPIIPPTPLGGGGNVPPVTPGGAGVPPFRHGGAAGGGAGGVPPIQGGGGFNAVPNAIPNFAANTPNNTPNIAFERRPVGRYVLAGGIVGYLVGRRRGRINTEKKLLPVQHKLEKEVTDLQQQIYLREEKLRSVVREQLAKKPENQQKMVERMQELQKFKNGPNKQEALITEQSSKQPERLGKFAILGERPFEGRVKNPETPKDVEVMTTRELLTIAENITIEGSNLKRLFEANKLSDEGLRRVIRAYLRGERYERVINENLKTPEQFAVPEMLQKAEGAQSTNPSTDFHRNNTDSIQANIKGPNQADRNDSLARMPLKTIENRQNNTWAIVTFAIVIAVILLIFVVVR